MQARRHAVATHSQLAAGSSCVVPVPPVRAGHSLRRKAAADWRTDLAPTNSHSRSSRASRRSSNSSSCSPGAGIQHQHVVMTNHNNAVLLPRNTAAAATAVAVVAAPPPSVQQPLLREEGGQQQQAVTGNGSLQQQVAGFAGSVQFPAPSPTTGNGGSSSIQKGGIGGRPPPPRSLPAAAHKLSRRLTNSIMDSRSVAELQQLYRRHADATHLNLIHISAMLKQLANFVEQQQQQLQSPAQQQAQQQEHQQQLWGQAEWQQLQTFVLQLEQHSLVLLAHAQLPPATAMQALQAASTHMHLHQHQQPQQLSRGGADSSSSSIWQHGSNSNSGAGGAGGLSSSNGSWDGPTPSRHHGRLGVSHDAVQPQQLSTICWSCARLGHTPSASWWGCYWAASTPLLHTYSSRELATAISAAGKLQQVPPATWMAAFESACVAGGGGATAGAKVAAAAAAAPQAGGSSILSTATPQELCMLLQGVAVLRLQPGQAWVDALQAAVLQQLHRMGPRDISQVLWGHASLALTPPAAWLSSVLAAAGGQVARFSARDTAMLLWALAALLQQHQQQQHQQYQQPWGTSAGVMAATAEGPGCLVSGLLRSLSCSSYKLKSATPQDYAHIAWAVATFSNLAGSSSGSCNSDSSSSSSAGNSMLQQSQSQQPASSSSSSVIGGVLPDAELHSWFQLSWQMTQQQLGAGTQPTSSSSRTFRSSSRQSLFAQHTSSSAARGEADGRQPQQPQQQHHKHLSCIDAAQLLWAASQLDPNCWPSQTWMGQFWSSQHHLALLAQSNAQSVTVTLWASLRMGHRPPATYLMAAVPVLQRQLAELQPPAACQLLCVLAQVQHRPNPGFMEQLLSRLQLDSHQLEPRAFACVLWALGRLGYQPGATWWATVLMHLEGMVGQLGQREVANVVFGLVALGGLGVCGGGGASTTLESSSGGRDGVVRVSQQLRRSLLRRAAELGVAHVDGVTGGDGGGSGGGDGGWVKQLPLQQLLVYL